ncbi:poly(A) polymerase [Trypanosoma rangeli]|uniref:Poly(A) polymerase n=1 Tax=Trypanosoma rangeli TaxID=5698 RepID=A0A422ND03_TRYRA|nr:poly(A) polymerase [Trypanosoma rangeli]RNF03351.1 poly(A) polymerase [Trypanosoma rangeli]|eukprot:RNF03351.1 poly(A) polymerase [Trypanosoma rangeli]
MEPLYGPTRPLEVPPAQPRDLVESKKLCEEMATVPDTRVSEAIHLIEFAAYRLVERLITNPEERWVRAHPFGSCGLNASVADSDLDMYGELFPTPFPPTFCGLILHILLDSTRHFPSLVVLPPLCWDPPSSLSPFLTPFLTFSGPPLTTSFLSFFFPLLSLRVGLFF